MHTYRATTTISSDGTLTLKGLPFRPGEQVEVTVCSCGQQGEESERYPLRGKPIRYTDPFGSVAEDDWQVLG